MKNAEEIYKEYDCSSKRDIIEAMKEYATQVAQEALKDAADNAKMIIISPNRLRPVYTTGLEDSEMNDISIYKESILKTKIKTP